MKRDDLDIILDIIYYWIYYIIYYIYIYVIGYNSTIYFEIHMLQKSRYLVGKFAVVIFFLKHSALYSSCQCAHHNNIGSFRFNCLVSEFK